MEQRPKDVRDIVYVLFVLHNMLRTQQGRVARKPKPKDEVPAIVNEPVVCGGR